MEDYKYLFKIVLIGNAGVGKTCLVRRFIQGDFPIGLGATIGVDFMIKPMVVNGIKVNLQLWDTAGQERFRAITQSYYRSAHCIVLVYDVSSQPSFDSLNKWVRDIEQYTGSPISGSSEMLRVMVGNKCDKERDVPLHITERFAANNKFDIFLETSALHQDNVQNLFHEIAERLVERKLQSISGDQYRLSGISNFDDHDQQSNGGGGGRIRLAANNMAANSRLLVSQYCCRTN